MAQINCKYHPERAARWACRRCHINFCSNCITKEGRDAQPFCPVCKQQAESLGAGNAIVPFWQCIPRFFLFPAHPTPLFFMLALTSVVAVISFIGGSLGALGWLLHLVIIVIFLKYTYVVLEDTAQGYLKPKGISGEVLTDELELPFKHILLIFALTAANFTVFDLFGSGIAAITILITTLSFPASMMVLAVEHSFFSAFNPILVGSVIKRIGLPYFILCFFLASLMTGSGVVMSLFAKVLPEYLWLAMTNFINMYFTLIMFNMMGYALYQYHEELGFSIDVEVDEEGHSSMLIIHPNLRTAEILLQEGKTEDAKQKLAQSIREAPGEFSLRDRYQKLLIALGDMDELCRHGADYISRLLLEKKPSQAMQVYLDCHQVETNFKPDKPAQCLELARLLKSNGQPRLSLLLLNNLHKEHPTYAGIPDAYLLVAQIMCEQFNEDKKAKSILNFILKKYPHHELNPQIRDYLKIVESLSKH